MTGLCPSCTFVRIVESGLGSRFLLCRRSETDARYPKYPRQPVVECVGYEKRGEGNEKATRN